MTVMFRLTYGLLLVLITATFGCSSTLPIKKAVPIHSFSKTYSNGDNIQVNAGTTMISILSTYHLPSYRIKTAYRPIKLPAITRDQEWVVYHTLGDNYILTTKKYPYNEIFGIEIRPNGELASETPWVEIHNHRRPVQDEWHTFDPQVFEPLEGYVLHDGFFRGDLSYNGMTEGVICIAYEEYVNYRARPSFREELSYDLNKSDIIVFRSIKIRVLKADNEVIEFQVIDDGSLPWVSMEKSSKQ